MTLRQCDDRIEPRLLKGRGEQHSRVKAGSDPSIENLAWKTDFLAIRLEARRWDGIGQTEIGDCCIDRRCDLPYSLAAAGLITVDAIFLPCSAQDLARVSEDSINRRIVRHGERRKQFRHKSCAAPFVIRKQFDRLGQFCQECPVLFEPKRNDAAYGFGEVEEKFAVDFEIAIPDRYRSLRRDPIHRPNLLADEGRVGLKFQNEPLDALFRVEVLDPEGA